MCQDIADCLDEGFDMDAIIIDFSVWFLMIGCLWQWRGSRTLRVRVGGQLSKEVKVTSGVPQGSVLGPLLFLVYVNDIWRNIDSSITFFVDDCIIYRKIANKNDIEKLQKNMDTLGEWAVENGMKINLGKNKAIRFTRSRVKNALAYSLGDQKILEASSCKYLGIILRSDLTLNLLAPTTVGARINP